MKLQYISDIHLERLCTTPRLKKVGSHLALIGDIGDPYKSNYLDFLVQTSYNYEKVFLVSGNHEYWTNNNIISTDDHINNIISKLPNITYLNNTVTRLDNYDVIGSTLWTPVSHQIEYNKSVDFLKKSINVNNRPKLLLTHYIPSYSLNSDEFKKPKYDKLLNRYCNDLDYLIRLPVTHWLCGHSHCDIDMDINGVSCGINAIHSKNLNSKNLNSKYVTLT